VSGLLETSHRIPNLDYNLLMKLALNLTDSFEEVEKLYRLMCFNIFAHNRDDHSKNFSFIIDPESKQWKLSPAYDLTYSFSVNGEHATAINGNGINPSKDDILSVAKGIGISNSKAKIIASEIEEKTSALKKFWK
jgi:serine/threonine-protein kinase HipA